jgi:uncharacterized protein
MGRRTETRLAEKGRGNRVSVETDYTPAIADRVSALDWQEITDDLDNCGCATASAILTPGECDSLVGTYGEEKRFRTRILMAQHGFGRGEYKYLAYPLPEIVSTLRAALYAQLSELANRWNTLMGIDVSYPAEHNEYLARCHSAGQTKPTPLLLQYGEGDYNCLHQDVYGEHVFAMQVAFLLSVPGEDFTGGEFVLTEQRPRMQSRPEVAGLKQGDGVIFAVHHRPVQGTRGPFRVNLRHGVSRIRSGRRHTLGIIFHDAK